MPSPKRPKRRLALLLSLSLATGCAGPGRIQATIPPAADLAAVTESKPVPTDAILTSAQADADYNVSVEAWGDRISAAGGRICRWSIDVGGKLPFDCPKGPTQ